MKLFQMIPSAVMGPRTACGLQVLEPAERLHVMEQQIFHTELLAWLASPWVRPWAGLGVGVRYLRRWSFRLRNFWCKPVAFLRIGTWDWDDANFTE